MIRTSSGAMTSYLAVPIVEEVLQQIKKGACSKVYMSLNAYTETNRFLLRGSVTTGHGVTVNTTGE